MNNPPSIAFCITGWHFPESLFETLADYKQATIYIVSHRPLKDIPASVKNIIDKDNILIFPNIGYDWGCYQQFLETGLWKQYDTLFFMHDDIEIRNMGFVEVCKEKLNSHSVIGNGREDAGLDVPRTYPHCYAHAQWKPAETFEHQTVRGSFFATTPKALEALGSFEIFWDRYHLSVNFGNWCLIPSCGKWESILGPDCFGFLSETFRESEYILELYRGGVEEVKNPLPVRAKNYFVNQVFTPLAQACMRRHWRAKASPLRTAFIRFIARR